MAGLGGAMLFFVVLGASAEVFEVVEGVGVGEGIFVGDGFAVDHSSDGEFDLFAADRVGDIIDGVDGGWNVSWCGLFADGGAKGFGEFFGEVDA